MAVVSSQQANASIATSVSREDRSESQGRVQPIQFSPTEQAVQEIWAESQLESITRGLGSLSLYSFQFQNTFALLSDEIAQACSEEDLTALLHTLQTQSSAFIQFASEHPSQETLKFSKVFVQLINLWESLCKKASKHLFHEFVIEMAKFGLKSIPLVRKDIATNLQKILELLISKTPSNDPAESSDFSVQHWIVPLSHAGLEYLNCISPSIQNDEQLLTIVYQNLIKAAFPMEFRKGLPEALGKAVDMFTTKLENYLHIDSYKTFGSFVDDIVSAQINVFFGAHSLAVTICQHKNRDTFEISACWMGWKPRNYDADMLPVFASMTGITLKTHILSERSLEVTFGPKDQDQILLVCRVINDINEIIILDSKDDPEYSSGFYLQTLVRILNNLLAPCHSYRYYHSQIKMRIIDEALKQFERTKQFPLFCKDQELADDIVEYLREKKLLDLIVDHVAEELTGEQPEHVYTDVFANMTFSLIPVEKREKIYERYFLGYTPQCVHQLLQNFLCNKFEHEDPETRNRVYKSIWGSCIHPQQLPDRHSNKIPKLPFGLDAYSERNQLIDQIQSAVVAELSGAVPQNLYSKLFTKMIFPLVPAEDRKKIYFHNLINNAMEKDPEIVSFLCYKLAKEKKHNEILYFQVFQAILDFFFTTKKLPNPIVKSRLPKLTDALFEAMVDQDPSIQDQVINELTGKTPRTEFRDLFLSPALSKLPELEQIRIYVENLTGPDPLLPDQIDPKVRLDVFNKFVYENKQKAIEYYLRYEKDLSSSEIIQSLSMILGNRSYTLPNDISGLTRSHHLSDPYDYMQNVHKACNWLDTIIKRLGKHTSTKLCQEIDKDLDALNQLATKDYLSYKELEDAFTTYDKKLETFKTAVQSETEVCATNIPLPEKLNHHLLDTLFPGKAPRINDFIKQNLRKVCTNLIIYGTPPEEPLIEGGKIVAILMAFYQEEVIQVYILRHLGSGSFKDVNLGFCLVGSGPENLQVISTPRERGALTPELTAKERLNRLDYKPKYILEVKPILDPTSKPPLPVALLEEYCDAGTLKKEIKSATFPLSPESFMQALDYSVQLAQALEAVHEANIVHLDVKPSNVLLEFVNGKKCVRLSDFGLWHYADHLENGQTGSWGYMPLEMFQEEKWWPSPAHDIWSFGITLVELFCGLEVNRIGQEIEKDRSGFRKFQPTEQELFLEFAYAKMLEKLDEQPIPESLKQLLKAFVSHDPKSRPTAAQARMQLEIIRNNHLT